MIFFLSLCSAAALDLEQADVTTPLRAEEDNFSLDGGVEGSAAGGARGVGDGYLMSDLGRSSLDEEDADDGAAATDHTPLR